MPLEGPDQLHLRAARGYIELEMFEETNDLRGNFSRGAARNARIRVESYAIWPKVPSW
jgi:hypothetical protein